MSEEFHEGDLVEAVKGDTTVRGRLARSRHKCSSGELGLYLPLVMNLPFANANEVGRNGWKFTVIEKAAPTLPTEPGWYSDVDGSVWRLHFGEWILIGMDGTTVRDATGIVSKYAPLTPLESASVTAKKVLDAIRRRIGSIDSAYDFQAVATQFGVAL